MLLLILIIEVLAIFLRVVFKSKNSYSYAFSTGIICLFLYLFGLLNILNIGFIALNVIIGGLLLFLIIYFIINKNVNKYISFNDLMFIGIGIIIWLLVKNSYFSDWDEFAHWGPNLKAMVSRDILWANKLWDGNHISYPPLAGVIEYLACKYNGAYSEAAAIFGLRMFIHGMAFSLLDVFTKKRSKILYVIALYLISNVFAFVFASINLDLPLSVLFFISLYSATNTDKKENYALFVMTLIILPLVKDSGLIFAGFAYLSYLLNSIIIPIAKKEKIKKQTVIKVLLTVLIPFVALITWKVYCHINGVSNNFQHDANMISLLTKHDIKEFLLTLIQESELKKNTNIFNIYLNSLNGINILNSISVMKLFAIINLVLIYIYSKNKKDKKPINYIVTFNLSAITYAIFMLFVYIYILPTHEGYGVASFTRYFDPLFFGIILSLMIDYISKDEKVIKWIIIFIVCLPLYNLGKLFKPVTNTESLVSDSIIEKSNKITSTVKDDEKVYIIYQGDSGLMFNMIRYNITPIRSNLLWEWSLGSPYSDVDFYTMDISEDDFKNKLINEKYDYIYLAYVDEQFVEKYGKLFGKDIKVDKLQNSLYKISYNNQQIELTTIE